jgi:hypothetical protein
MGDCVRSLSPKPICKGTQKKLTPPTPLHFFLTTQRIRSIDSGFRPPAYKREWLRQSGGGDGAVETNIQYQK